MLEANNLILEYYGHKHADYDRNLVGPMSGKEHLREAARLARKKLAKHFGYPMKDDNKPVFRFCFVRHPLSWYESFWKFTKGLNWDNDAGTKNSRDNWHPNSILNGLGSDDFNEFVRNVVKERPGYVSELYFAFTKPGISFIGKNENLRKDFAYVLDHLGLKYDQTTIESSERQRVSKTPQSEVQWDPKLRETVMRLEVPALLHFDYLSVEEKNALGIQFDIAPNKALQRVDEQKAC
jgi:hypothetical protein